MAKYLAVAVAVLALLCLSCRTSANVVNDSDYDPPGYKECKAELNNGAPRCFEYVYFNMTLNMTVPISAKCCQNYLQMDSKHHDCFDLLFDDPTSWFDGLMKVLSKCKAKLIKATSPGRYPAPYPHPYPTPTPAPAPGPYPYPAPAPAPGPSS